MTAASAIVFAVPSPKRDTPERMSFVKRLAKGIQDLGTPVHLFPVVKSVNPIAFVRQGLALRGLARESGASLVVAQFGSYTGLLVAVFGPRPIVMTFRGSDLNPAPDTNRLVQAAQHAASHFASVCANGIVCVSRELSERLRVRTRLAIIPSPTDLELFRPRPQGECRRAIGWPEDAAIAVFLAGMNSALKGLDLARQVGIELERRRSAVTLKRIEQEVPITQMPVYLNAADGLLFLSRFEGSPNLIREASACNLPIVTTAVGDTADVLRAVEPHRFVSRDPREIADALEAICGLRARSNGRESMGRYATADIARRTLDFYNEIVTAHAAR